RLVLHGARTILEGLIYEESNYDTLKMFGYIHSWEVVKAFDLTSIDQVIESCKTIDPLNQEGYVVCDGSFNRVKVKSPQYLALHSMKDGFGPKRVIEMIRLNESDEWLAYFPEFQQLHDKYRAKYDELIMMLAWHWLNKSQIESQKDFALAIKDVPFNGALFQLRAKKINSVKEYLAKINIQNLVDYFK
ncbi:MAG TPA: hypothetical protein VKR58_11240, partial [Aquella sp.]|nr:hypothetical protein [Aquella sp.]